MSGFNLGNAVNGAADWACSAPIIRSVVSNPVFTALLITALAAIVVMSIYHYQIKRAGAKRGIRALLYVFLVVTAVTFVHHYAVMRIARDTTEQKGIRAVFSEIAQSQASGAVNSVPVYPMGYEGARIAVGGASADCGCPDAEGGRPDNIAADNSSLPVITDVMIPSASSPFREAPSNKH